MKYAVIDIGSNTIRLNLYNYIQEDQSIRLLMSKKTTAGLASYVKKGLMSPKGIDKLANVLNSYRRILRNLDVEWIYAFATASLRNVSNSQEILREISLRCGLDVELIPGEMEAIYGYQGLKQLYHVENGVNIDIGGGSSEIVIYQNGVVIDAYSMPEGSLSLFTQYVTNLLPDAKEEKAIRNHIKECLDNLNLPDYGQYPMVTGVGGTIRAANNICTEYFSEENVREISVDHLKQLRKLLIARDPGLIQTVLQVVPDRIHTLTPGILILLAICKHFNAEKVLVSTYGVREGYLLSKLEGSEFIEGLDPVW